MLRLGLGRQLRGVGCEKRERGILVSSVLSEVEVDAADQMPRGVLAPEKCLERYRRFRQLGSKRLGGLRPERLESRGGDVLGAVHRRSRSGEGFEFLRRRGWNRCLVRLEIGMRAN